MAIVSVKNIRKQFGSQIVFENISLDLVNGEIVGLVGPNGCGKTTLLRIIAGHLQADGGDIERAKNTGFGYLAQKPEIALEQTLHDEVSSVFEDLHRMEQDIHVVSEQLAAAHAGPQYDDLSAKYDRLTAQFEAAGGYTFGQRMNEVLGGLGFSQDDQALPMSALSGGQKCRAALAKLLLAEQSFLLLDEPTNHLDIDACRWLERFLGGYQGGAVIISHDRYLLDRVVDRIVEMSSTGMDSYPGNYTNYINARETRRLTAQRQFEKDQLFIEKEKAFIAKHISGQRTKEAQGRRTRLERQLRAGELSTEGVATHRGIKFNFDRVDTRDGPALTVRELTKSFDGKYLFESLNFQVEARERFAITGPNGSGKSTLLKLVMQQMHADDGQFEFGYKTSVGYYAQETVGLEEHCTALEYIHQDCPHAEAVAVRGLLGAFGFRGDEVFKDVQMLSGGEQSRLRLLRLILSQPNMLILDEPTNHLDIQSCEALESALQSFPGTIVVVSHDRYFLDRIAHRLLVMRPSECRVYSGNYSFYLNETERQAAQARQAQKQIKKQAAQKTRKTQPTSPFERMSTDEIEAYIADQEAKIATINEAFGDAALYSDPHRLKQLRQELETCKESLAAAEEHWLERETG